MAERERMLKLVFDVVEEINAVLPMEEQIFPAEETPIFGYEAGLDSRSLLDLILGVEGKLRDGAGPVPHLAEVLVGQRTGCAPETLGALATFIANLEDAR